MALIIILMMLAPLASAFTPATSSTDCRVPFDEGTVTLPGPALPEGAVFSTGGFIRNDGQLAREDILYYTGGSPRVGLTQRGALILLSEPGTDPSSDGALVPVNMDETRGVMIGQVFEGGDPLVPVGLAPQGAPTHFLLGNDPAGWTVDVPTFDRVLYEDVWDGIDIVYRTTGRGLKYDILVAPGANVDDIRIRYEGVDGLSARDGRLVLQTVIGDVIDGDLMVYQEVDGQRTSVPTSFVRRGQDSFGFRVSEVYDDGQPLIIDPLIYGTFVGGRALDINPHSFKDDDNNVYIGLTSTSNNFPVTTGAYSTLHGGNYEGVVIKYDDNLTMEWCTYLGGADGDRIAGIHANDQGYVYLVGRTRSMLFPTTTGAYCETKVTSEFSAFTAILSPDGSSLSRSTLLNGARPVQGEAMVVDDSGNVYIGGFTNYSALPTTAGAAYGSIKGRLDMFIVKFDPTLSSLLMCTYMGGSEADYLADMIMDESGDLVLVGRTLSDDFPQTSGGVQSARNDGSDMVIAKISADGSNHKVSTYYGGSDYEESNRVLSTANGDYVVIGYSSSAGLASGGAYCETYNGNFDGIVLRLPPDLSRRSWCTYLGGPGDQNLNGMGLDGSGNLLIAGETEDGQFPDVLGAPNVRSNQMDAFMAVLTLDGKDLTYAICIGSGSVDYGSCIMGWENGTALMIGFTGSAGMPVTDDAADKTFNGNRDLIIYVLDCKLPEIVSDLSPDHGTTNDPYPVVIMATDDQGVGTTELWYCLGESGGITVDMVENATVPGRYEYEIASTPFSVLDLTYSVTVYDLCDNWVSTEKVIVPLIDNTPPQLLEDLSPTTADTGETIEMNATFTDNVGVGGVYLEYWYGTSEHTNVSLGTEEPFNKTLEIPTDSIEPLRYVFAIKDSSDNWNTSVEKAITIYDVLRPEHPISFSDSNCYTGNPFHFEAMAEDNIDISWVTLTYWFADAPEDRTTVDMTPEDVDTSGRGTYVYDGLQMPPDSMVGIEYYFNTSDSSGNWRRNPTSPTVKVIDDDPPVMVEDGSDPNVTTGDTYIWAIVVEDNIGIDEVKLKYWFEGLNTNEVLMEAADVDGRGNGLYTYSIEILDFQTGDLLFEMTILDVNGQFINLGLSTKTVMDNDAPIFGVDLTDLDGVKGGEVQLSVSAEDNIGVTETRAEIFLGDTMVAEVSMELDSGFWKGSCTAPRDAEEMTYVLYAVDASGNEASKTGRRISLVNIAPEISPVPKWVVTEGLQSEMDLADYITDGNDPLSALTVSVNLDEVEVEGTVLRLLCEYCIAIGALEVTVSDGEEEAMTIVSVQIIDVNDPPSTPVITSFTDGTNILEGDNLTLECTFDDPDLPEGQVVQVTWTSDLQGVLASYTSDDMGPVVIDDLTPGEHTISVTVNDGEFDSSTSMTITVEEGSKSPVNDGGDDSLPSWVWAVVVLVVVLVALVAMVMMRSRPASVDVNTDAKEEDGE